MQVSAEARYDTSYQDQGGLSTIGFRSAKHTPLEWIQYHKDKYDLASNDRCLSKRISDQSKELIQTTSAITNRFQCDSTKRLKERVHDILFWKTELEREIQDIITETDLLVKEKQRLENALLELEYPLMICTDNLNTRDQRCGIDKVADSVEKELLLEMDVIHNVRDVLKKTIEQAEQQIMRNRAVKEAVEMNWSDKLEAEHLDATAGYLTNSSTNKQFYAGVALFQEHMSDPEKWAKAAHEVISQAEAERKASTELRSLISNLLTETARDLRHHHDLVCRAFQENLDRMISAKIELENQLKKTVDEVAEQEKNIERLKEAIRAKDDPLKVAQTRLHLRGFRPNLDLCKDPAMENLVTEVDMLTQSLDQLLHQLNLAENKLKDLQDVQVALEKDLQGKRETIHLEEVRCLPKRSFYPSALRLQGYP